MEENIEIISVKKIVRKIPIKFIGYKCKKTYIKYFTKEKYEIEMCIGIKEVICPSREKYKFVKGETKPIPATDANFLLRFKDEEGNYCFEIDM